MGMFYPACTSEIDFNEAQTEIDFGHSLITDEEFYVIVKRTNKVYRGMANRANYRDMARAIGNSLKSLDISREEKIEFAINIARTLHSARCNTARMTVDVILSVAGIYLTKTCIEKLVN